MADFLEITPGLVINIDSITQIVRQASGKYAIYFSYNDEPPLTVNEFAYEKIVKSQLKRVKPLPKFPV